MNIKEVIQNILIVILSVIGITIFLILIFLIKYSGDKIPVYYLYLTILGLFIVGFGLFKVLGFLEKPVSNYLKNKNVFDSDTWQRLKIKSQDIQVISSPYYKEVAKSTNWRSQALDSISDDSGVKRERVDMFYLKYTVRDRTYMQVIVDTNEINLKIKLSSTDYVNLYINRNDKNDYYFDL